ncbi:MAG: phosphoribosylformylglycinamidine synthase [Bacteroidetes bacterium]|nr:phosphoribosylformylglycinamidine synthase [Bacteroidota bacterium]
MILFYKGVANKYYVVECEKKLISTDLTKLKWLFGDAQIVETEILKGFFVGPRKEMITPWSTNAVEITQNMGVKGIIRIEEFFQESSPDVEFDKMLKQLHENIKQNVFDVDKQPEAIIFINNIDEYNKKEGLALNADEIKYLEQVSEKIGRKLTDSEVFGFSQVNSEHCRHKIFNGKFIIDGQEKDETLFQLIKKTTKENPNKVVSAYKDNCAFVKGPLIQQFAPKTQDKADYFTTKDFESVLSIKAETHNFPTTVEPFNGAATGTGGEIRDRMAGGKASMPIAGTAVYMTPYSRVENSRAWENNIPERNWLYQTPIELLIKASNGASDFGNKFGQPIICGSLLTFEHAENNKKFAFDKVIMQAGGIGYAKLDDSLKDKPELDDKIVVLGGDNYRIGMGGGAVSSVATGEYNNAIELNAVQRSNPEMQKRVSNAIRALAESDNNPIVSIHDHGAGGHLNCLSELVEDTGGKIDINKLPIGDSTLSAKEIIGNESQERMGLVLNNKDVDFLQKIADRERAPMFVVGDITGDMRFTFEDKKIENNPLDLKLEDLFGKPPKTILNDINIENKFDSVTYDFSKLDEYLENVLQIEAVACKDWLTNKVDRSVTGRIALQQNAGTVQLPLNNCGVVALDYQGEKGFATSLGHAPVSAMINPVNGSRLAIAKSLTNIVWAPLSYSLKGVSLSANWMWPAKNKGEDARLYKAVEAVSNFAIELGINIPTGKDSLSMTQKYDNELVSAPGTVIISAAAEVSDIKKTISPVLINDTETSIFYINISGDEYKLGGSSFAQINNKIGNSAPTIKNSDNFIKSFNAVQKLISDKKILSGHDISAGGMITSLLEMCFANNSTGLDIDLSKLNEADIIKLLFSENPAIVFQAKDKDSVSTFLTKQNIDFHIIGQPTNKRVLKIKNKKSNYKFDINHLRDVWYKTSYLLDKQQCGEELAKKRFENYKNQELKFNFSNNFTGKASQYNIELNRKRKTGIKAAIIREKGVNGDREMAYSMYLAGMDVKDIHMTDLISGRETLQDVNMIVFVGGFSNSDVLGSAKGWAGAFLFNDKAKKSLDNFYKRMDTISLGVCNGCQLMVELGLITPKHEEKPTMLFNDSHKFESGFINVDIQKNNSIMLQSLQASRLGVWVAHGEGKFKFPYEESKYNIPIKYSYSDYPANPNGSAFSAAAICSDDGRHLAMMPHLERSVFPWQWANYPEARTAHEITPWVEAFVNARKWIEKNK